MLMVGGVIEPPPSPLLLVSFEFIIIYCKHSLLGRTTPIRLICLGLPPLIGPEVVTGGIFLLGGRKTRSVENLPEYLLALSLPVTSQRHRRPPLQGVRFFSSNLRHEDVALHGSHLHPRIQSVTEHIQYQNYQNQISLQIISPAQGERVKGQQTPWLGKKWIIIITSQIQTMSSMQRKAPPFLIKTYEMLENGDFSETICWNQQENGFIIQDVDSFSSKILPIYFKHKNMHSYIRQLNMYGFSKKRGRHCNFYHHPCFLRRQPELISHIQRRVENKTPKAQKQSTASIDDQLPHQALPLLRMNQFLLLEQCANLQIILDETAQDRLREDFSSVVGKYLEAQNKLLQRCSGAKQKQLIITTGTLQEEREGTVQECSEGDSQ